MQLSHRGAVCGSLAVACIVPVVVVLCLALQFVALSVAAPRRLHVAELAPDSPFRGLSADNLSDAAAYTWVQITDTHIRENGSLNTLVFRRFCTEIISVLKPTYVVHSGDIVDNFKLHTKIPMQRLDEWEMYKEIRENCSYNTTWFEVVGNHDTMMQFYNTSNQEHYTDNKKAILEPVRLVHMHSNHPQSATVADDQLILSPKVFMFNIFADLLPERAAMLRAALANQTAKHRPGIVVAHHPMNDIAARQMTAPYMGEFPRSIKYSMHISGHTHTRNYIRYPSGTLELNSQASFKGYVRLWAFDNHFLTLTDEVAGDWPYVLVTYPKAAKFIVEEEPLIALKNAKQIRAAIISERPIQEAQVKVDGVLVCESMTPIKDTQFYSCPWNSSASCAKGLHKLEITVFDGKVRRTEEVVFSLDGTVDHLGPRLMVGMQMPTALFGLWALVLVCAGATLLALGAMACVWKHWKRNPSRALNVSVCFGPVSTSHIARTTSGKRIRADAEQETKMNNVQKGVFFATYWLQATFNGLAAAPGKYVVALVVLYALQIVAPVLVGAFGEATVPCFAWASVVMRRFTFGEVPTIASLVYLAGVYAPFFAAVVCAPRMGAVARACVAAVALVFSAGVVAAVGLLSNALTVLASPLTYEVLLTDLLLARLFFATALPSARGARAARFASDGTAGDADADTDEITARLLLSATDLNGADAEHAADDAVSCKEGDATIVEV